MVTELLIGTTAIAGIGATFAISSYNRLVALAQRCDQSLADVDVQLRHRHDLIPSLVETVRSFANHERGIVDRLMSARAAAMSAQDSQSRHEAETVLSSRLGQVMATVESYPELRGSQHFSDLRREISDVENKIAAARRFLNMATSEYNASRAQFPVNLIASRAGMHPRRMFDLGIDRVFVEEVPTFKF